MPTSSTESRVSVRRARAALAALVFGSFVVKTAFAWLQATPVYLPDEYMYSALSRSLVESGRPLVQGGSTHLWALLVPVLEAPAWLFGRVATAYRAAQAEQALAISLSAVPVYCLARRLRVNRERALVAAGLTLLIPDTVFSSTLVSESFALPLFLASACVAIDAVARGGCLRWAAFGALATLTTTARLQFVPLLALAPVTGIVVEARRRRIRAVLRLATVLCALGAVAAAAWALAGTSRLTGRYASLLEVRIEPGILGRWAGYNGLALLFASGWIIVPAALVGLTSLLVRPTQRADDAFGILTAFFAATSLAQAAFFAAAGPQAMERYTFYVAPLLLVAFATAWERGLLRRRPHAALALAVAGVGLLLPRFLEFLFSRPDAAPSLLAYRQLDRIVGLGAPVALGIAAAALGLVALALGRRGAGAGLAWLAAVVVGALLVGAQLSLHEDAKATAMRAGSPFSFADDAGARNAIYVAFSTTSEQDVDETAFWNRSIVDIAHLGKSSDSFRSLRAKTGREGQLLVDGRSIHRPLVVDRTAAYARFDKAPEVETRAADLIPPGARLRELVDGYIRAGGWLAPAGIFAAWPRAPGVGARGVLELRVWVSGRRTGERRIELRGPDCTGVVPVTHEPKDVRIRFASEGAWRCRFFVPGPIMFGSRHSTTVHATVVCFEQAPRRCAYPAASWRNDVNSHDGWIVGNHGGGR
jgi:hypothetical protein